MKILNINARTTDQVDVALPFETDEHVLAAWEHIFVTNRRHLDFSYRPESDGEDRDRAYIESFLQHQHAGTPLPSPVPGEVRRLIPKLWGAELNYDIRELLGVNA